MNLQKLPPTAARTERGDQPPLSAALLKLPFLITVERLVEDRGFGFATCEFTKDELFFHISADLTGRRDFLKVAAGDLLLCQIGSRPKEPDRQCVVQWLGCADLNWNDQEPPKCQSDLDAFRREALHNRTLNQLHQQMDASWYVKQWAGEPPADLRDPILGETWIQQLSRLDPLALEKTLLGDRLNTCCFDFRESIDPASPRCSVIDLLTTFSPAQLAVLGQPQKNWLGPSLSQDRQAVRFSLQADSNSREFDDDQKATIFEWFLLRHIASDPEDGFDGWLQGIHPYEAIAAQRLLDHGVPLPAAIRQWIAAMAVIGLITQPYVDRLAIQDPSTAAQLFRMLSADGQRKALADWTQNSEHLIKTLERQTDLVGEIALRCALAVDLETDGERIWEIGCASGDVATRLHDEAQGTDITTALADLGARMQKASLIVGHNILVFPT